MTNKFYRWLREGLFFLLILVIFILLLDNFRAPQAPYNFANDTVITLAEKQVTLAELSAKQPLLLYFWASWCGICRFTSPKIADYAANGGNVLTVAFRSGDDAKVQHYLRQKHFMMPTVNDPTGAHAAQWHISVTPTFVIIYKGKVVSTTTGWSSLIGLKLSLWWSNYMN